MDRSEKNRLKCSREPQPWERRWLWAQRCWAAASLSLCDHNMWCCCWLRTGLRQHQMGEQRSLYFLPSPRYRNAFHRLTAWLEGTTVGHFVPPSCSSTWHRVVCTQFWNISSEGDSTPCLGILFQGSVTAQENSSSCPGEVFCASVAAHSSCAIAGPWSRAWSLLRSLPADTGRQG